MVVIVGGGQERGAFGGEYRDGVVFLGIQGFSGDSVVNQGFWDEPGGKVSILENAGCMGCSFLP